NIVNKELDDVSKKAIEDWIGLQVLHKRGDLITPMKNLVGVLGKFGLALPQEETNASHYPIFVADDVLFEKKFPDQQPWAFYDEELGVYVVSASFMQLPLDSQDRT